MMHFVYVLESGDDEHRYVGLTNNYERRLTEHNSGNVKHTSKFRPWVMRTVVGFDDRSRAAAFESYLKSGSGRAFAKKRL